MNAFKVWRSLLCLYEFNSDNKLSAATGGPPRHQKPTHKLLIREQSTTSSVDSSTQQVYPSHPTQPQTNPVLKGNAEDQAKGECKTPHRTRHQRKLLYAGSYADYDKDPVGIHEEQLDNTKPQGVCIWKTPRRQNKKFKGWLASGTRYERRRWVFLGDT